MLEAFLGERSSQIEELLAHYSSWAPVFKGQEELVLGFGLFEALHLMKNGHQKTGKSIDSLLTEVLSP